MVAKLIIFASIIHFRSVLFSDVMKEERQVSLILLKILSFPYKLKMIKE